MKIGGTAHQVLRALAAMNGIASAAQIATKVGKKGERGMGFVLGALRRYGRIEKAPGEEWKWRITKRGREALKSPPSDKTSAESRRKNEELAQSSGYCPKKWAAAHEKHLARQRIMLPQWTEEQRAERFDPLLTGMGGDRG